MINNLFKMNRKKLLLKLTIVIGTLMILFVTSIYVISFLLGPPHIISEKNTIYYSQNEEIIGEEKGLENRYWVDIEDMSPAVIQAAIAIEDKNFFHHNGFDIKRIIRAALSDLQSLSLREGASTLTQQYARNLFLTHEKTWSRKFKEAFYTVRLEMYYGKEEILEGYLNTIYFGHGAYGIEAASKYFFNKNADQVTLAEAAMLIGIPKGPTYYSPLNDLEKATARQQVILEQLLHQEVISKHEYETAINQELTYVAQKEKQTKLIAPHFQNVVLKEAEDILQLDHALIKSGGYKIYTTLNTHLQQQLEEDIKRNIHAKSDIEIGAIVLDPQSGAIQALVGGRSFENSPFNRAVSANRMVGSTFKPFLYYAALENNYTASTKLMSKPTIFSLENNETYQPSNFNGYYADKPITLAQAIALSDNIYAVKTNLFMGPDVLVNTARKFGITSELPEVPSLALGTASISVDEMVTGYGILANGGKKITSHTIDKIIDQYGNIVFERKNKMGKQILDPMNTFILTQLMTGMFDRTLDGYMAVTGSTISNQLTRTYAGKSGTTNADSWMIGYSPTIVTGIWTGYDDNRNIEIVSENAYAKNIWADFMEAAHQEVQPTSFPIPPGIVSVRIDPASGQIATPYCPINRLTYFKKGTEPTHHCMTHFPSGEENIEVDEDDDKGVLQRLFERFMW
jgi:1A family penicillin-binding protein